MKYFEIKNSNGSVDFGCCEVHIPVGSIEISEEKYNALLVEFEENKQSEPTYTLDEVAEIILDEVSKEDY